jgi:hypothetical protein
MYDDEYHGSVCFTRAAEIVLEKNLYRVPSTWFHNSNMLLIIWFKMLCCICIQYNHFFYLQLGNEFFLDLLMWLIQVAASMQKDVEAHVPNYPNIPLKLIYLQCSVILQVIYNSSPILSNMTLLHSQFLKEFFCLISSGRHRY